MLTQPTIEKLCAMRLRGIAEAFQQQQQDANIHGLSFEERLGFCLRWLAGFCNVAYASAWNTRKTFRR